MPVQDAVSRTVQVLQVRFELHDHVQLHLLKTVFTRTTPSYMTTHVHMYMHVCTRHCFAYYLLFSIACNTVLYNVMVLQWNNLFCGFLLILGVSFCQNRILQYRDFAILNFAPFPYQSTRSFTDIKLCRYIPPLADAKSSTCYSSKISEACSSRPTLGQFLKTSLR